MTKQNFLAMSLDSGLKAMRPDGIHITPIFGIDKYNVHFYEQGDIKYGDAKKCKPILHSLSDLTKEIEHNGEKFVPIVELAKIASSKLKWVVTFEDGQCYIGTDVYQKQYIFFYSVYEQSFYINSIRDMKHTPYQFKLFQKLIEWHFDIADLISKNEAIDINTIENPYK